MSISSTIALVLISSSSSEISTHPCYLDRLKPLFYMIKMDLAGVWVSKLFLIFALDIDCGYLLEPPFL